MQHTRYRVLSAAEVLGLQVPLQYCMQTKKVTKAGHGVMMMVPSPTSGGIIRRHGDINERNPACGIPRISEAVESDIESGN